MRDGNKKVYKECIFISLVCIRVIQGFPPKKTTGRKAMKIN